MEPKKIRKKLKRKREKIDDDQDLVCIDSPPLIELDDEVEEISQLVTQRSKTKKQIKLEKIADKNIMLNYEEHELEIKKILEDISHTTRDLFKNYILVVSGATNTGKSTFARYFLNAVLLHDANLNVYHMECDCGQTEFTVPGCVSLTKITEPVIGKPYSHLRDSEICYYFGDFTPVERTEEYLSLLIEVKKRFDFVSETRPSLLVVNTNGWTTGRGCEILLNLLNIARPDHLICMRGGPIAETLRTHFPLTPITNINFVSINDVDFPIKNSVAARDLSIISYFDQMLNTGTTSASTSLREIVPYAIPWKKIKVSVIHAALPPDYLMSVLMGNIVALCRCNKIPVSECDERWLNDCEHPLILPEDHFPLECLGFGIVRGIDTKQKLFYVITPLNIERLKNVDILVKGAVCLPKKLILREAANSMSDSLFVLRQLKPQPQKEQKVLKALHRTLRVKSKYKKRNRQFYSAT